MSHTVALRKALDWHDELMDLFHQGRGDKEKRVRGQLSEESGIPESYLFRLQHKRRDMRDVAGEAYRLLCETVERYGDALEARRLGRDGNAVDERAGEAGQGTEPGRD